MEEKELSRVIEKLDFDSRLIEVISYIYKSKKINDLSNLKLQKLLFYCFKEYYKKYDEELFKEKFEAGVYGPVIPKLYKYFSLVQKYANETVTKNNLDEKTKKIINKVIKEYGSKNAGELVELSHMEKEGKDKRDKLDKNTPSNRIIEF